MTEERHHTSPKEVKNDVLPSVQDPFAPVMHTAFVVTITEDQRDAIRRLLAITSSDSRMAQKAYVALELILAGGVVVTPEISHA